MSNSYDITIAICSYNRAKYLPIALDSILEQQYYLNRVAVILIDNNSTDNTVEVFNSYKDRIPNFDYILEERQGLSRARNRALQECRTDYLAYIDDDSAITRPWIEIAVKILQSYRPIMFGGPVYPLYEKEPPKWYRKSNTKPNLSTGYICSDKDQTLTGCNFVVSVKAVRELGGFNEDLGMGASRKIGYAEEVDLQKRIEAEGKDSVYWHQDLSVKHLIRADQQTFLWNIKSVFFNAHDNWTRKNIQKTTSTKRTRILGNTIKAMLGILSHITLKHLFRNKEIYPYHLEHWYYANQERFADLGRYYAMWKSYSKN